MNQSLKYISYANSSQFEVIKLDLSKNLFQKISTKTL